MENSHTDNHVINLKRRVLLGRIIGTLIVLGALATGIVVWRINYQHPRTNDAMVRANIVGIAPEVSGRIVNCTSEDNQYVKQGDLLYVIDPRPYQAKLAQARAELLVAEKDVDSRVPPAVPPNSPLSDWNTSALPPVLKSTGLRLRMNICISVSGTP